MDNDGGWIENHECLTGWLRGMDVVVKLLTRGDEYAGRLVEADPVGGRMGWFISDAWIAFDSRDVLRVVFDEGGVTIELDL